MTKHKPMRPTAVVVTSPQQQKASASKAGTLGTENQSAKFNPFVSLFVWFVTQTQRSPLVVISASIACFVAVLLQTRNMPVSESIVSTNSAPIKNVEMHDFDADFEPKLNSHSKLPNTVPTFTAPRVKVPRVRVLVEGWMSYMQSYSIVNNHQLAMLYPFTSIDHDRAARVAEAAQNLEFDSTRHMSESNEKPVQGEPTECVRVRGDGVNQGDVEEVDRVVRRSCGLSLETYELPPYQMHWPRRNASLILERPELVRRLSRIPSLSNLSLQFNRNEDGLSIDWRPSSTQYFTKVNKTRKRRHDIVYRIASPLNLNFPFTKTDLPTMFMFYTAETKTLLPSQFTGGTFADFVDRCRSGHIVPITPSQWSAGALRKFGVEPVVLPHGVDTLIYRPGLIAEARAFQKTAKLPDEILTDSRSFVFLSVGAMTPNKNIRGMLEAFFRVAVDNPFVHLVLKCQSGLFSAGDRVEQEVHAITQYFLPSLSERADVISRVYMVEPDLVPSQMAGIYNFADAYVSPYHAEAFNMPVLEAMACGIPVIVPTGGPTADFTHPSSTVYIQSVEQQFDNYDNALYTKTSDIVAAMRFAIVNRAKLKAAAQKVIHSHVIPKYSWPVIGQRLAFILTDPKYLPTDLLEEPSATVPQAPVTEVKKTASVVSESTESMVAAGKSESSASQTKSVSTPSNSNVTATLPQLKLRSLELNMSLHDDNELVFVNDSKLVKRLSKFRLLGASFSGTPFEYLHGLLSPSGSEVYEQASETASLDRVQSHVLNEVRARAKLLHLRRIRRNKAVQQVSHANISTNAQWLSQRESTIQQLLTIESQHLAAARELSAMMSALHQQQHPSPAECKSRRLLLLYTQHPVSRFDGLGAVLKTVMLGLGQAAYENRTLVWGGDQPLVWDLAKDEWSMPNGTANTTYGLNCDGWQRGGGAFNCFFQSLSSCSLPESVTAGELNEVSLNAHNDSARLKFHEPRRANLASYFPPPGQFQSLYVHGDDRASAQRRSVPPQWYYGSPSNQTTDQRINEPLLPYPRHRWGSALAAYVFRLKPEALQAFQTQQHKFEWPMDAALDEQYQQLLNGPLPSLSNTEPKSKRRQRVWSMHVRRGDIVKMSNAYGNRLAFDFDQYFVLAKRHAEFEGISLAEQSFYSDLSEHEMLCLFTGDVCGERVLAADTNSQKVSSSSSAPNALFIGSDDVDAPKLLRRRKNAAWSKHDTPELKRMYFGPDELYRTPHGSHTVAADGACMGSSCAMPYDQIAKYQAMPGGSIPRSQRLMRVLFESARDLYLLSAGDRLIGTAQSSFTTMSALVLMARTVCLNHNTTLYIDQAGVDEGLLFNSFYEGTLNGTSAIKRGEGHFRWHYFHNWFREQLPPQSYPTLESFGMLHGIPRTPTHLFLTELYRWQPAAQTGKYLETIWPEECPYDRRASTVPLSLRSLDDLTYAVTLLNKGVEFHERFFNQAQRCWSSAQVIVRQLLAARRAQLRASLPVNMDKTSLRNAIIQAERDDAEMKKLIELQEVAVENRLTLARNVNKPFAYEIADLVRQLIRIYGEQQPHWTLKLDHLLPMSKVFLP